MLDVGLLLKCKQNMLTKLQALKWDVRASIINIVIFTIRRIQTAPVASVRRTRAKRKESS